MRTTLSDRIIPYGVVGLGLRGSPGTDYSDHGVITMSRLYRS